MGVADRAAFYSFGREEIQEMMRHVLVTEKQTQSTTRRRQSMLKQQHEVDHFAATMERQKLGSTTRTTPSKLLKHVTRARSDVLFEHTHQVVINRSVRINRLATAWVVSVRDADGIFVHSSNAVRR
jgi:hypothetical protein